MGKLDEEVPFITGAARGQGRSDAVLFAEEGADIIAVDLCAQVGTVEYPMATLDDLEERAALVEKQGRRPLVEPEDISRAMLYLCSEDGCYITGITLSVDAGLVVA